MTKPFRVVALADTHVGSQVGLAEPGIAGARDIGVPVREALYKAWVESTAGPWAKPDALILVGDLIEGQNRKGAGIGTWSTELVDQADHAVELLSMWGAKKTYVVRGSKYHVGETGIHAEEYIARELGAEEYPNQEHMPKKKRARSGDHWYLTFGDVTFHAQHHIGVSRVWHYRTTPMARELLYAKLADGLRHSVEGYKTQVCLRAHAHYFNAIQYPNSLGVALPCWKGLDDFLASRGALSISPSIGFVGFETQDGEYEHNENLWRLEDVQPAPHTVVAG